MTSAETSAATFNTPSGQATNIYDDALQPTQAGDAQVTAGETTTDPAASLGVQTQPVAGSPLQQVVTWNAATPGQLPILGYAVRCTTLPELVTTTRELTVGTTTPLSVVIGADIAGSTAPVSTKSVYQCAVATINAAGTGTFSTPSLPFVT